MNAPNANQGRLARKQARRHQRERIVGVAIVCLGIAVLVVAAIALREPNGHSGSSEAAKTSASSVSHDTVTTSGAAGRSSAANTAQPSTQHTTSAARSTGAPVNPKDIPLVVLNNTTVHGLAADAAQRFEAGGWTVTSRGNYTNDIASTCAYYDPSVPGAREAAEALQAQYPTIKRVKPKFAQLPAGPVVVVLTPDYSST